MNYVLERISTVPACDALLAGAKRKKQDLERRMRNLGELLGTFRKRIDQVSQESAQVQSCLEAFTGAYGSLPQGKDKINMNIRIKRLELDQALLQKKATVYHVAALLAKEVQYNQLAGQVSALEAYIIAVEQRRAALEDRTLRIVAVPALPMIQSAVVLPQPVDRPALIPSVLRLPVARRAQRDELRKDSLYHVDVAHYVKHLSFATQAARQWI